MYITALAFWAAFLFAAAYYTRRGRHPRMRPLAAYLIFGTVFIVASFTLFAAAIVLIGSFGQERALGNPIVATIFLLLVFVPAFLLAHWLIRKPPRPPIRP